jgi:hypothetical protein
MALERCENQPEPVQLFGWLYPPRYSNSSVGGSLNREFRHSM